MVFRREPLATTLTDHRTLDPATADDRFIATALELGPKAVFVTADTGATWKARDLSVHVRHLDNHLREPEEPDARDRRITVLERELSQLKSAAPDLRLVFNGGGNRLEYEIPGPKSLGEDRIRRLVDGMRHRNPPISWAPGGTLGLMDFHGLTRTQAEAYNSKLAVFFEEYESHMREFHQRAAEYLSAVRFDVLLKNRGAVGDDIDVVINLPSGTFRRVRSRPPSKPPAPLPPERPRPYGESGVSFPGISAIRGLYRDEPKAIERPNIERQPDDSWTVRYHVRRVKHLLSAKLPPLYLSFAEYRSLHVEYSIGAANAQKRFSGKLHLILTES